MLMKSMFSLIYICEKDNTTLKKCLFLLNRTHMPNYNFSNLRYRADGPKIETSYIFSISFKRENIYNCVYTY